MKSTLLARLFLPLFFLLSLSVVAEDVLRVGVSPDYPPLIFMKDGEITGIEAHNAMEVGKFLKYRIQFVPMKFENLFPALQSGEVDVVMSGISVSPERAEQVLFTESFMEVGQMAIISLSNVARFSRPRSLHQPGVRIGVEPGTMGETLVRETMPEANIRYFEDPDAAFAALRAGHADAYIHDAPTSWRLGNDPDNQDLFSLYRPLSREDLAWAVRKDNFLLQQQLNVALDELRRSGRLRAIQNFWIPVRIEVR